MNPADHKEQLSRYFSEGVVYYRGKVCDLCPALSEDPKDRIGNINIRIKEQALKAIQKENK